MIDWPALGRETVELLQAYLRIDTTNPPGNENLSVGAQANRTLLMCSQPAAPR